MDEGTSRFDPVCPSGVAPIRVGEKWTAMAISLLTEGPLRYSEIRARIGPITSKVLTATLRGMERDGFLTRTQLPGPPRSVHYELTDLGRTLLPAISLAEEWAQRHLPAMLDAQEAYDLQRSKPATARP